MAGDSILTPSDAMSVLNRVCFGHLAFSRGREIGVIPVRYALREGWLYFRAGAGLREIISRNPWVCVSVTEPQDQTRHASVVVRGGCYATEETGSAGGDAQALRGVVALRDRPRVGPRTRPRQRHLAVFRLHIEETQASITLVPCPAGERPYDDGEVEYLRVTSREQSSDEDSRADDDGMAAPNAATLGGPESSPGTR
jgi:nitroimidazol reductase NimA-like FMN-containing flavoprotein (pyridoxamine 5'-phosphate oxidase superfamily)